MGYKAHSLRDLLSLARLLRDFAERHPQSQHHDMFVSTAVALEAHIHLISTAAQQGEIERSTALHAPVNRVI